MKIIFDYKKTNDVFDFKRKSKSRFDIVTKKGLNFLGKNFVTLDTGLCVDLSFVVYDKDNVNICVRPIENLSTLGLLCWNSSYASDYKGRIVLKFFNFDSRDLFIPPESSIAEMVIENIFEVEIPDKTIRVEPVIEKKVFDNFDLSAEMNKIDEEYEKIEKEEKPMNLKNILSNLFKKKEEKSDAAVKVEDESLQTQYRVDINDGKEVKVEYLNAKNERAALINLGRLKKKYPGCDLKLLEFDEKVKLYKEMAVKEKKEKVVVDDSDLKIFIIEKRDKDTKELIEEIEVKGKDGRTANAKLMGLRKKEPGFIYEILKNDEY